MVGTDESRAMGESSDILVKVMSDTSQRLKAYLGEEAKEDYIIVDRKDCS